VGTIWVYQARYRTPISKATAGSLVLVEGIDATISKTATVVAEFYDQPVRRRGCRGAAACSLHSCWRLLLAAAVLLLLAGCSVLALPAAAACSRHCIMWRFPCPGAALTPHA
jgi:hypothetical protein